MTTNLDDDGSEDVNDFLKRIKELGDQRDREDEERTRKLEQDIIQGRKERQARREERARSLSPSKDSISNAGTPGSVRSRADKPMMENLAKTPSLPPPRSKESTFDDVPRKPDALGSGARTEDNNGWHTGQQEYAARHTSSSATSPSATAPSRAGTLSWQQRPSSRGSTSTTNRPSSLASDAGASRQPEESKRVMGSKDDDATRSEIARSLGSKDPAWFRQTQDRGMGSAAYRRNQDDERSSIGSRATGIGLPGMSREITLDSRKSPPSESIQSISPASITSEAGGPAHESSYGDPTFPSVNNSTRSPLPTMSSQKLDHPSDSSSATGDVWQRFTPNYAMSPSQRGLSPERIDRPASPTKGLGGFVQSAMMKRSDSVSKRWSAQPTQGLNRADSVSNNRSAFEPPKVPFGGIGPLGEPRPTRFSRESTPATNSRPSSSQSNSIITPKQNEDETSKISNFSTGHISNPTNARAINTTPPPEAQARPSSKDSNKDNVMSPPTSPGKRWSPQKSSWLEKAINKPESPKVFSPGQAPHQPSWIGDVARAKQQRGSVDLSKGPGHKEITTGGLMRAPPPAAGYKPPNIGGVGSSFNSNFPVRPRFESSDDLKATTDTPDSLKNGLPATKSLSQIPLKGSVKLDNSPNLGTALADTDEKSPASLPSISTSSSPKIVSSKPPVVKLKPEEPPKQDFTSTLKSRPLSNEGKQKDEPEFRNVFGKLKPTQTQKYKAPDELKDNITRGKAGLAFTGGPKKTDPRDEFKESILKKKQGMVTPSASTKITGTALKKSDIALPEALQRRQGMKRSDSTPDAKPAASIEPPVVEKAGPPAADFRSRNQPHIPTRAEPAIVPTGAKKEVDDGLGITFASSLSGILQRGPPKPSPETKSFEPIGQSQHTTTQVRTPAQANDPESNTPQLTHATKGRARGPKRRPPTATQQDSTARDSYTKASTPPTTPIHLSSSTRSIAPPQSATSLSQRYEPRPLQNITNSNNNNRRTSQPASPRKPSTSVKQPSKPDAAPPKPSMADADAEPSPTIMPKPTSRSIENRQPNAISQPISTPKTLPVAVKNIPLTSSARPSSDANADKPSRPDSKTPSSVSGSAKHFSVAGLLSEIFDDAPSSRTSNIKMHTQTVIDTASSKASFPRIKTLRKQILEIGNNGKSIPVPSHQEHILFEDSLYLCSHVFGTPSGQRMTEVYLWCGDGTSPSAVEDAQLFAKRFAKDNSGRLIVLQQGKETSSFFQALGGIVITRRGSSSRAGSSNSASQYMLRGRQHIGQVAFDEIDFSSDSLCSGFPHIVSPGSGKVYLWKGNGASADEVGCARLIGMDIGATGEIEEVNEGQETKDFWASFPRFAPRTMPTDPSSHHWHLKSSRDTYNLRLFSVDTEVPRPKSASSFMQWGRRGSTPSPDPNSLLNAQIKEIVPFSQADLVDEGIMLLDTFFEIFVIHPLQSFSPAPHRRSRQSTQFRAALLLAQEYAILAASAEDRPSVPQARVVFLSSVEEVAEVPEGVRCAFRKWDGQRVRGCKVLGLPEVLEAVGASRDN